MELNSYSHIYFLGIGGIGMSGLARYFNAMGKKVSGYDKTPSALTDQLISEGIEIHFSEDPKVVSSLKKKDTLVVLTPAVPNNHSELVYFKIQGFNIKKRSEVLGLITEHAYTIAVAGTHGKTTTSSLVAHILKVAGKDISAFLGGITSNYGTNVLIGKTVNEPGGLCVVEADEYDRSFLTLSPKVAVITSADADHLDIYGNEESVTESFTLFSKRVLPEGKLIVKDSVADKIKDLGSFSKYSLVNKADFYAENISIENGYYRFDAITPSGKISNIHYGLPGRHNVENAVAAIAAVHSLHLEPSSIKEALTSFKGVKRRFEKIYESATVTFIDDYAHHPEELKAFISSVRELYPGKRITGIFQPHLYSRTRDFAAGFSKSLSLLDEVILLDIYPARELPIEGVSSEMLLENITSPLKRVCSKEQLSGFLADRLPEVVLTMGAGDIDMLIPEIKKLVSR